MPGLSIDPVFCINPGRRGNACRNTVSRARDYANGDRVHDHPPIFPLVELGKVIRPHQPHEPHLRIKPQQCRQCIRCCPRSGQRLDIRHLDARVLHQGLRRCHTLRKGGGSTLFQGISGRHQPPHPIQPKGFHRLQRDMHMPLVRWVERPAEQTDHLTGSRKGYAAAIHLLLMFRTEPRCQSAGRVCQPSNFAGAPACPARPAWISSVPT